MADVKRIMEIKNAQCKNKRLPLCSLPSVLNKKLKMLVFCLKFTKFNHV